MERIVEQIVNGSRKIYADSGFTYSRGYQLTHFDRTELVTSQVRSLTLVYDANGNMTHIYQSAAFTDSFYDITEMEFDFDKKNRMIKYRFGGSGNWFEIKYDALGRVRSRLTNDATPVETKYYSDGRQLVQQLDANDAVQFDYLRGATGLDRQWNETNDTRRFYIKDNLGTVWAVVDPSTLDVKRYNYNAWGEHLDKDDTDFPTDANSMRYIGCRVEGFGKSASQANSIYHFGKRHYLPMTSFLQRDPISIRRFLTHDMNPYNYAKSSPSNNSDPTGLSPCHCHLISNPTTRNTTMPVSHYSLTQQSSISLPYFILPGFESIIMSNILVSSMACSMQALAPSQSPEPIESLSLSECIITALVNCADEFGIDISDFQKAWQEIRCLYQFFRCTYLMLRRKWDLIGIASCWWTYYKMGCGLPSLEYTARAARFVSYVCDTSCFCEELASCLGLDKENNEENYTLFTACCENAKVYQLCGRGDFPAFYKYLSSECAKYYEEQQPTPDPHKPPIMAVSKHSNNYINNKIILLFMLVLVVIFGGIFTTGCYYKAQADIKGDVEGLDSDDPVIRAKSLRQLAMHASWKEIPLQKIINLLDDENDQVRISAVIAIGGTNAPYSIVGSPLIDNLKDKNHEVRGYTAAVLGEYGGEADNAVEYIVPLLSDSASVVRAMAVQSLGEIGGKARNYIEMIKLLLQDDDEFVRSKVNETISKLSRES